MAHLPLSGQARRNAASRATKVVELSLCLGKALERLPRRKS